MSANPLAQPAVFIHFNRREMGVAAAAKVHEEILRIVADKGNARMVMACAPSQDDYYAALIPLVRSAPEVWRNVEIFHMDEYVGLTADSPQSFRSYLREHFLDHVEVAGFHPIGGEADPSAESVRYEALLSAAPIDIISMGIGENGHIAFNDPPVADFNDPYLIKKVELDGICRQQQVNDGCFPTLDAVPTHALSLTLPVFAGAGMLVCIVPGVRKAEAVRNTLLGPVGTACPATLLRGHANSFLYLDDDSASLLDH
ncbi:glucosamine-6-phosphate deaminase [Luteolibacter sp. SL250]|uniref:glucosamine-6-phosphate deaminase n=1 Tax=Luteolibacter sp. SL250 TaxID=2995170 RepID=UPI00227205CE|nr:glucosamine-6-phosphate deaminase [Luteolibacter sp. SL250]WAC21743.1 glucosamine-6-phosphate deaminase [Luteolibacter sp. SL250]